MAATEPNAYRSLEAKITRMGWSGRGREWQLQERPANISVLGNSNFSGSLVTGDRSEYPVVIV